MANNQTPLDLPILAKEDYIADWFIKMTGQGYETLTKTVNQISANMEEGIFNAFSAIFFNSIAYNLIGIIVVVWAIYHMRSGFSRDDIFKGGIWLLTICFIYGVLSSYGAYAEFKSWFLIPQLIMQEVVHSLAGGQNLVDILKDTLALPYSKMMDAIRVGIYIYEEGHNGLGIKGNGGGSFGDDITNYALANIVMAIWALLICGSITLLVLIIFIIQIATMFSLTVFGCFAPIMVACLVMPQTKGFFFSWLRNYISISLYLPLSVFPLLIIQSITKATELNGGKLFVNTGFYVFIFVIAILVAFYITLKIPEWINIIMGTQEGHSNMAMAQSAIGGAYALGKTAGGKALGMGKGAVSGAWNAAGATSRGIGALAKDPKGVISAGTEKASQAWQNKKNQIKEHFGFKSQSQHYDKNQ